MRKSRDTIPKRSNQLSMQEQPPPRAHGYLHKLFTRGKNIASKSLRLGGTAVGIVAVAQIGLHYYQLKQVEEFFGKSISDDNKEKSSNKNKKRVLVLPFDNLKVIEQRKAGEIDLQRFANRNNKQPTITIAAKELVDIIKNAASDETISALYADFGEGMRYSIGMAHIEEIRNALRIFNESHRVHREPNVNHNPVFAMMRNGNPKPSYAFGHGFSWNEYFLASSFSYVTLQARGGLSLFGTAASNIFLGGMFDKYGIKAHVFRHGEYKNAPSIFTDKKYSKTHLESVKSMTSSLNNTICTCINNSRALSFDDIMWKSIFEFGSLTPSNATEIGLIDATPPVDYLLSLLDVNKEEAKLKAIENLEAVKEAKKKAVGVDKTVDNDEKKVEDTKKMIKNDEMKKNKKEMDASDDSKAEVTARKKFEQTFGINECYSKLTATEQISLAQYKQMLNKREKIKATQRKVSSMLGANKSTAVSMILSGLGLLAPDESLAKRDKVAVVTVDGQINTSLSYEIVRSLRQIKSDKNVKSVVLRVNSPGGSVVSSEAILEEIKLLDKPVICSMSNSAASGGYYVAMNSEKIFANPTTLTGSIGVFGIKFDASKMAASYGVYGDSHPYDSHATATNPLTPLTNNTKKNIARQVLEYYDYFKGIVSTNRALSLEAVEQVAQGKVHTGEQAKEVGLVDELGGLDRAISYAKTNHVETEQIDIEHWPKRVSNLQELVRNFFSARLEAESSQSGSYIEQLLNDAADLSFTEKTHFLMTMDDKSALDMIIGREK